METREKEKKSVHVCVCVRAHVYVPCFLFHVPCSLFCFPWSLFMFVSMASVSMPGGHVHEHGVGQNMNMDMDVVKNLSIYLWSVSQRQLPLEKKFIK